MPITNDLRPRKSLLLLGGGHTHLQILESLINDHQLFSLPTDPYVFDVTLISQDIVTYYSGLIPSVVAGECSITAAQIDLLTLCQRASVSFIHAKIASFDLEQQTVRLQTENREFSLTYDVISINLGSTIKGIDLPGVIPHTIRTRPLQSLLEGIEQFYERKPVLPKIIVVGGGPAGIELSWAIHARWNGQLHLYLISRRVPLLQKRGCRVASSVGDISKLKGIDVIEAEAKEVLPTGVLIEKKTGERELMEGDLVVWAAGAVPPAPVKLSFAPKSENGWLLVDDKLQMVGYHNAFAAGDCCSLFGYDWVDKAGVYAVRQGPFLIHNLKFAVRWQQLDQIGESPHLKKYVPQHNYLSILISGKQRGFAIWHGFPLDGRICWLFKMMLDTRFMQRFQLRKEWPCVLV